MLNMSPIIGKVMGIPIQLHWTFIFLLLLSLLYPTFFIFIILLFIFVTLHELAHSITAKNNGIDVKKIILYPLGGGSIIDMNDITPKLEMKIALAGPVSNFFIAALLGLITIIIPGGYLKSLIQILFLVNLLLGALNIIPAFPLDGGRILRSYLQRKKTHLEATIKTSRVSRIIAAISMVLAIMFMFIGNYTFTYRVMLFISFFILTFYIYSGTQAETYSSKINTEAKKLSMTDMVSTDYIHITKRTTLSELNNMVQKRHTNTIIYKTKNSYMLVSKVPPNIYKMQKTENAEHALSYFSIKIPNVSYNLKVPELLNKMNMETVPALAITKSSKLIGIIFKQYIEYMIALKLSTKNTKHNKS